MQHARLAPSSAKRWMSCPGSVALCEKVKKIESEYAAEGTAAHTLAELCVLINESPYYLMGTKINGFVVDDDMVEAVSVYVALINSLDKDAKISAIEKRFSLDWIDKDIFGTNDFFCVIKDTLHVVDYKHGKGVEVDPEWNPQLMIYALGALKDIWIMGEKEQHITKTIKNVDLTIVQPRFDSDNPIKSWTISTENLLYWGLHVLSAAAIATRNNQILAVGEHCRFCDAIGICQEQSRNALSIAGAEFSNRLPEPEELTGEQILKVLNLSEIFRTWADKVKMFAQTQLETGKEIPGYKLVKKRSNRKWIDEEEASDFLFKYLEDEEMFSKKLLSPSQIEKIFKSKDISLEIIADLYEKPDAGLIMAPDNDKRQAQIASCVSDFIEQ